MSHKPGIPNRAFRNSKQRQAILDVIETDCSHLSAEEIYQQVRLAHPRISLGTVYRNLDALTEQGMVERTIFADGKSRYETARHDHHHHLICLQCGEIEDLPQCPMDPGLKNYLEELNFEPVHHHFEIYGYCTHCQHQDSCPLKESDDD